MSYLIFSLSLLLVYVALTQLLHVQFGMLGIPNFGIVGFWGLGMYGVGVFNVQYSVPFLLSLILTGVLITLVAFVLGRLTLRLNGQDMVCACLLYTSPSPRD